ncbi:MAG: hypothetical protein ABI580_02790 [Burkholderiaceae bacterium]
MTAGAGAEVPLPAKATPCGLPLALEGMLSVAVRALAPAGVKVTLTAQFAPGRSDAPVQLLAANSAALPPVMTIAPSTRVAVPVLLIETVRGALFVPIVWLPKSTEVADSPTAGVGAETPLPLRLKLLELGEALWPTLMVALRLPRTVGLNVALIEHDWVGASDTAAAHVPVRVKSDGLVPVSATDASTRLALPVFVSVADMVADVVSSTWLPKPSELVERVAIGAGVPAAGFTM